MGSDKYLVDNPPSKLYWLHCKLHAILPIILILLFVLLSAKLIYEISNIYISIIEFSIIVYFISEIIVDGLLYKNKRIFLKHYWINILLILPFLAAFRLVGRSAQLLNSMRGLELIMGSTELASISSRLSTISRLFPRIPYIQKSLHLIVDLPKAIKKLIKITPFSLGIVNLYKKYLKK